MHDARGVQELSGVFVVRFVVHFSCIFCVHGGVLCFLAAGVASEHINTHHVHKPTTLTLNTHLQRRQQVAPKVVHAGLGQRAVLAQQRHEVAADAVL